ncbi:zinc finger domain containing protein [Lasius niger]|uniref:Zinc finger domain containing protein n=1 Tax=Lasius niger TaxID=67767 RepID=A0A0J7MYY3_LASNI|nr:zinc finger domain containing protein [Lasius niger]
MERYLQVALRDQFVCGLRDQETKTESFRVSQLSFEDAYKLAAAHEEASRNATNTEKIITGSQAAENALVLYAAQKRQPPRAYKDQKKKFNRDQKRSEIPRANSENKKKSQILCYCCNKPNHMAKDCHLRFKSCNLC